MLHYRNVGGWINRVGFNVISHQKVLQTKMLELNYKTYRETHLSTITITELMFNIAELNVFEMAKRFPDKIEASKKQISQLQIDIKNGDKIPPIIVEEDAEGNFVTIADGLHRLLAHQKLNLTTIQAQFVVRE